jgi:hypothetical protein
MNIKYLVTILLAVTGLSASASQILWATGTGRGHMFTTNSGARLDAGSLVRVGYLTTAGDLSTFTEFAATTISHPGAAPNNIGGFLTNPAENLNGPANVAARNKQIYIWVYNAPTAAAATEQGIFTSTDPSWIIPSSFTGDPTETNNPATALMLPAGVVTAQSPPLLAGNPLWVGPTSTKGPITVGTGTNPDGSIYRLGAIVPEPGTAGLLLLGLLGLARRRR